MVFDYTILNQLVDFNCAKLRKLPVFLLPFVGTGSSADLEPFSNNLRGKK